MNNSDYNPYFDDDEYDNSEEIYEKTSYKNNNNNNSNDGNKKNIIIIIGILIIIVMCLLLINSCSNNSHGGGNKPNDTFIAFESNELTLSIGESKKLKAEIINGDPNGLITWSSNDFSIVSVDADGTITALKKGKTIITATHIDANGKTYTQQCTVNVNGGSSSDPVTPPSNPTDKTKPTLTYTITNGNSDWYSNDVSIKVSASDSSGISNIKYAVNCSGSCNYITVANNGTFKVTNNGTNNVTIIATDKNNNQTTKTVIVKIDKTTPTIKLSVTGPNVYTNKDSIQVCATCTDTGSGCAKTQECKTYTSNQSNIAIEIADKANNKGKSSSFNIIFDKIAPTCRLDINDDTSQITGTQSDTGGSGIAYYGFSSSYSGANTKSKTGVEGFNYYYVKDNAGNTGRCTINLTLGYRSRACYQKAYTWTLTNSKTCADGFKNRSREEAEAAGRLWYRSNCSYPGDSYVKSVQSDNCTGSTCKCCKEYTGVMSGCKTFEGSIWSDWSYTPLTADEYTEVQTKLISAD